MATHADQRYIKALCEGEETLLREVYAKYAQELRYWVLKNSGTAEDAQDLFQDGLMAIYGRYCERDFELSSPFGALLMGICRRQWYDRLSQKKREQDVRNAEGERYISEEASWDEAGEALRQAAQQRCLDLAFQLLSEQCQQLLGLIAAGKASTDEMAEQLGMAANAIYQSKHRCTARWRQLFYEHFKTKDHG